MTLRRPLLSRGRQFDLEQHRYLAAIYADTSRESVYMKGGQLGLSERLISESLWACSELGAIVLYVMPTDGDVSDFSTQRFGPAVHPDVSPHLASIITNARDRGADRVGLKRIGDGWLYMRGGKVQPDGSAHQLHNIPADILILDEYDLIDPRALPIASQRLGHSALRYLRLASTPTYFERGIHAEYLATDRCVWMVTCGHCGNRQPLDIKDCVTKWDDLERPVEWRGGDAPTLGCRKCGQDFDRLGPGEWVAELPDRDRRGYAIPGLASPFKDLAAVIGIGSTEDGKPMGLMSIDETTRKQVFNQDLGQPYEPRSAMRLTETILDNCKREYAHGPVQKGEGGTFMGVDVGGALHIIVRDGKKRQRFAGAVASFTEVAHLMDEHKVLACVVDALPETRAARSFQKQFSGKVWLAYYGRQKRGSKELKEALWDSQDGTVDADRTRTLDATYVLFILAARGEDGNTLPANIRKTPDYFAHLRSPMRQLIKDAAGEEVAVYTESGADHYAHAENYCHIASLAPLGWVRGS